mmetsp:Transcript_10250/g.7662  ORF Transcript_10250/g.7662 Transcript_10250/m.7662 type:complete len:81 (-) Transcript_10250:38-280(-)|eukprot:CAMPEP_0202965434 /NCGR_PEP_ID=MMETSP1396-20130829/9409_1 /ASSEMBLY_ACC=CAM_ASM_000872 /TAXON_ID= /ORGANISM="Pseudokeronopsis sp., Strain Brazil" /LENGTH=80 /DNA_ID=CAMNT_0049688145 /DNA_START=399 /DNA_END=641 /DNA_ORIENTATION=+
MNELQNKLDEISRNVYVQQDLEKENFELTLNSAATQRWMSILKMVLVGVISFLQVYFIIDFFAPGKKGKGAQGLPGRGIV